MKKIKLNQFNLNEIYFRQSIIYRIFNIFKSLSLNERRGKLELLNSWIKEFNFIADYEIIFDERIWFPESPQLYGNALIVRYKLSPTVYVGIIEIDLSKDSYFNCTPENEFEVIYVD